MTKRNSIHIMLLISLILLIGHSELWGQGLTREEALQKRAAITQDLSQLIPQGDFTQKGKFYQYIYPRVEGSHLLVGKPLSSNILFEGMEFSELSLSYDIYNDLVFTTQIRRGGNRYLILPTHKLDEFWIDQRHFIRLDPDFSSEELPPGFYQLSYEDKGHKLLTKWKVKRNHYASSVASSKTGQKPYKFVSNNTHYLWVGNVIFPIANKKDLLDAFPDIQGLKEFLKKNKIKLKNPQNEEFIQDLRQILEFLTS